MNTKSVTVAVTGSPRLMTAGQRLRDLRSGQSIVVEKVPRGGSVEARRLPAGGVQFYWRYTQGGRTTRVPIGPYDPGSPPKQLKPTAHGFSVAAALESARDLARTNAETPGGLRSHRDSEEAELRRQADLANRKAKFTLAALCEEYVKWLDAQGKVSAYDAKNLFDNHLIKGFPELSGIPAVDVQKRDVLVVLRKLVESGKATTARKLRSYLRAAYGCALRADSDATLPSALIEFGVTSNPVEAIAAIQGRSAKNPLSAEQLRQYWRALKKCDGVIGAALRLHVLTGGQRPAQLVRVRVEEVSAFSLKILDSKGRRAEPRVHLLPVTPAILREIRLLPSEGYLFSTDGGTTPMHATSLSSWASEAAAQAEIDQFQLKRVRSGIETVLAEAGVSLHVRGLLQSHGVGGVQEKHYDAHEYMAEKRQALEVLADILQGAKSTRRSSRVRPLRGEK